jgi:hypothetical protein
MPDTSQNQLKSMFVHLNLNIQIKKCINHIYTDYYNVKNLQINIYTHNIWDILSLTSEA